MNSIDRALQSARSWLPVLAALLALALGLTLGLSVALLTLAASVLVYAVLLLWSSLQGFAGQSEMTLDEALSLGAQSVEEEQKQAILRALKDLEYERSVGKLSDEDYNELSQRYRQEAKRILASVQEEMKPTLERIEARVRARLAQEQVEGREEQAAPDLAKLEAVAGPEVAEAELATAHGSGPRNCPECEIENDADAVFCKRCGYRFAGGTP